MSKTEKWRKEVKPNTFPVRGLARVQIVITKIGTDWETWDVKRIRVGIRQVDLSTGPVLKVPEQVAARWIRISDRADDDTSSKASQTWYEEVVPEIEKLMPRHWYLRTIGAKLDGAC